MYDYYSMGKISSQMFTNGNSNSLDILQHNINDLFHEFELICMYIYDVWILTKGYWTHNVQKL